MYRLWRKLKKNLHGYKNVVFYFYLFYYTTDVQHEITLGYMNPVFQIHFSQYSQAGSKVPRRWKVIKFLIEFLITIPDSNDFVWRIWQRIFKQVLMPTIEFLINRFYCTYLLIWSVSGFSLLKGYPAVLHMLQQI